MQHLIEANIFFLDQAERLLEKVEDEHYGCSIDAFYGSTVGQHLRHCLDHYSSLLSGLAAAKINYDRRERVAALESCTEDAIAELSRIREGLRNLLDQETPVGVLVKMDCGGDDDGWQPSTFGRELQFLVSHTVHHFAMIGGMCSCLEVELEKGFGVAPSTLKYRALAEH
ncbi:DinB family protein [Akkermansiaceae bacterium]|nr:DinB family protein [Akkermansiaceae bacterium]